MHRPNEILDTIRVGLLKGDLVSLTIKAPEVEKLYNYIAELETLNTDMFADYLHDTFRESIKVYGKEAQCRQAMEECAELIQAINKCLRYPKSEEHRDNLVEEICDVEIMLYQLKEMFSISETEVADRKYSKAKREQDRLRKKAFKNE